MIKALEPAWHKPATAKLLRLWIEAALGWATVRGLHQGDNLALWKNHLKFALHALPAARHYAALPFDQIADLIVELRQRRAIVVARALEFLILTATRTSEAFGAACDEIDLAERLWTIPASRMKAGREHRVPLSAPALAIIEEMRHYRRPGHTDPMQWAAKLW